MERGVPLVRLTRAFAAWFVGMLLCQVAAGALAQSAPRTADTSHTADTAAATGLADTRPRRIVALLPSLTETVCALGACDRLVGTDSFSNWPVGVLALPKLGGLDDLQVERVVALKPDLVLVAESLRAAQRLQSLGLRVVALEPRNMADTRRVIERVAVLLGRPAAAAPLWADIERRLAASAAQVPSAWRGASVYFEVAETPYAAGASSFIGEILARLGLQNVIAADLGPFPQISPEWVVRSAPMLLMGTSQAVQHMSRRPGWSVMPAVARAQVCGFDAAAFDTLMRPGPRLPDAAEAVLACLQRLPAPAPAPAPPPR